jgi:hypothetical protein
MHLEEAMLVRDAMVAAIETRWIRHPEGGSYAYIHTDQSISPSLRTAIYGTHPKRETFDDRLMVYRTRGTGDRGRFEISGRSLITRFAEYETVEHPDLKAELDTKLAQTALWYERDKHVYLAESLPGLWAHRKALLADPRAWWAELDILGFGSAFGGAVNVPIGLLFELWEEGKLCRTHADCGGLVGVYRGAAGLSMGHMQAACTKCGAPVRGGSGGTNVRSALVLCRERLAAIGRETRPSHPYRFDRVVDLYGSATDAASNNREATR